MAQLCFLSLFIWTWCLVAGQSPEYVLKETTHVFRPRISGQPNSILWKHNGNKVVEFDGNEEQVYSPFVNRVTLDWVNADLEITGLRFEDSGTYEYEVDINNHLDSSEYQLKVIDKVSIPTISCDMNKDSSSGGAGSQATLMCSTKSESSPSFEWKSQGKVIQGQRLQITLGDQHDDEVHTCSVKNPLSSEAATFTAKECYPDNSPPVGLISGLVVSVLVVLLVIIALYLRHKKKACFAGGDVENPVKIKGSAQDDGQPLINQKPTRPSTQPLRSETTGSNAGLSDSANNHTEGSDSDYKTETGSDKKATKDDENKPLLDRSVTLPSHQPLVQGSENKPDEGQKASPVQADPEASPVGQSLPSPTKSPLDTEPKKTDDEHEEQSVSEQEKRIDEVKNATSDQDVSKISPAHPSSPLPKSGPGSDSDSPAEETDEESHTSGTPRKVEEKGDSQTMTVTYRVKQYEDKIASPVKAGLEASSAGQPPSSPTKSSLDKEAKKTDGEHEDESVSEQEKMTDENATSDQDGAKQSPPAHPSSSLKKSGPGRDSDNPAEETNEESHTSGTPRKVEDKAQPDEYTRPDEAPTSPYPQLGSVGTPDKDKSPNEPDVSHREDHHDDAQTAAVATSRVGTTASSAGGEALTFDENTAERGRGTWRWCLANDKSESNVLSILTTAALNDFNDVSDSEAENNPGEDNKPSPVQAGSEDQQDEGETPSPVHAGPEASSADQQTSSSTESSVVIDSGTNCHNPAVRTYENQLQESDKQALAAENTTESVTDGEKTKNEQNTSHFKEPQSPNTEEDTISSGTCQNLPTTAQTDSNFKEKDESRQNSDELKDESVTKNIGK